MLYPTGLVSSSSGSSRPTPVHPNSSGAALRRPFIQTDKKKKTEKGSDAKWTISRWPSRRTTSNTKSNSEDSEKPGAKDLQAKQESSAKPKRTVAKLPTEDEIEKTQHPRPYNPRDHRSSAEDKEAHEIS